MEKKIKVEKILQDNFDKLHLQILEILKNQNSLSVSDIQKLSGANYSTLKVKLKDLVKMKKIVSVGKGRGVVYQINPNQN